MDPLKPKKPLHPFKNPIEMMREGSSEAAKISSQEVFKPIAAEFMKQILGQKRSFHGEIQPGESIEMKQVFTGNREREEKLRTQLTVEKSLRAEEQLLVTKRSNELRVQIEAIKTEVTKLALATPKLAQEVEIASFQAPGSVSTYELFFLQHLFEFIKGFREHIDQAHIWLAATNSRARKRNMWGANYKKHGAKYLFSGEHYSGRSAA